MSANADYCNGYCLQCRVFPPGDVPTYIATFSTNISINMAQYGGGSKLDFAWSFWPLYCQTGVPSGTSSPIHSQIGDTSFDDSFPAVDFNAFDNGDHTWNTESKANHSGTASVNNGNGDTVYLPISIRFALSPIGNTQFLNYYVKGIGLQIGASFQTNSQANPSPLLSGSLNALSSSPSSTSNSSRGITSTLPSSSLLSPAPTPELLSGSGLPASSTPGYPAPTGTAFANSPTAHLSTAIIAGVTVGIIVFTISLILAFLFLRRHRRQQSTIVVSQVGCSGKERQLLDGTRDTHHLTVLWSGLSEKDQTSILATDDRPTNSPPVALGGSVQSQQTLSITESRRNLLDRPISEANSAFKSRLHRCSVHNSSMNLPDLSLGDQVDSTHAFTTQSSSIFSGIPYDPSPVYRADGAPFADWMRPPSSSPALVEFVVENRDLIPESLEEKLITAGYLPTDDPGNMTAEEWRREYGVTGVEYLRLLRLYAKRNGTPASTTRPIMSLFPSTGGASYLE